MQRPASQDPLHVRAAALSGRRGAPYLLGAWILALLACKTPSPDPTPPSSTEPSIEVLDEPLPQDQGVLPLLLVSDGILGQSGTREGALEALQEAGRSLGATAFYIVKEGPAESGAGYQIEARAVLDRRLSEEDIPGTLLDCRQTSRRRICVSQIRAQKRAP